MDAVFVKTEPSWDDEIVPEPSVHSGPVPEDAECLENVENPLDGPSGGPGVLQPQDLVFTQHMCIKVEAEFIGNSDPESETAAPCKTEPVDSSMSGAEESEDSESEAAGSESGTTAPCKIEPADSAMSEAEESEGEDSESEGADSGSETAQSGSVAPKEEPQETMPQSSKGLGYENRSCTEPKREAHESTSEKPYACDVCERRYNQRYALNVHKRLHDSTWYYCDYEQCTRKFTNVADFQEHQQIHVKKTYECDICNKTFKHQYKLDIHYRCHTGEKPYACETCGRKFSQAHYLRHHEERIHMKKENSSDDKNNLVCNVCQKQFTRRGALYEHKLKHVVTWYQCDYGKCIRKFSSLADLHEHQQIHVKKIYECDLCEKVFKQQYRFQIHYRFHTGEKPFACKTCGKKFSALRLLKFHEERMHMREDNACRVCNRVFSIPSFLEKHEETCGETYSCDICKKEFVSAKTLKKHMRNQHERKKEKKVKTEKYICQVCNREFMKAFNLRCHQEKLKGECGKPIVCDICNKTFATLKILKKHKLTQH